MSNVIWSKPEELGGSAPCLIFQPPDDGTPLPLVYLLHGQFDTEADWFGAKGQIPGILTGLGAKPMILVMPWCGAEKLPEPKRQKDPGLDAFAARFLGLDQEVRKRIGGGERLTGVLGISMGGRQALHLALTGKIPGLAALGVLSGKLQDNYADELAAAVGGLENGLPALKLYFNYCGSGGTDDRFLAGNKSVCEKLGGTLSIREKADHNWWYWRPQIAAFFRAFEALERTTASTVGIVGGLGQESTIDYYRRIHAAWLREDPTTSPSLVLDSLDVQHALHLVEVDRPALIEYLLASLRRLGRAGVDFAAMTANTTHIVFDELVAQSPVPLVSIVETCAEEARRRGLRRLVLLGTRFTMEGPFYPTVFARYGIEVLAPNAEDRAWVHQRYVGEFLKSVFRDETREEFISLITRLRDDERIDGVILGGTELPLLLTAPVIADVPLLDTTALHVAAIVARLRAGEQR